VTSGVRLAFVCCGQGAEVPRMGLDLAERVPAARELLDRASAVAGVDVPRLLATGGADFQRTSVIQPMLTAVTLATSAELARRGVRPVLVAGHSLGELAAWSVAGGITAATAVELAGVRGRLMERETLRHPGGMLALTGDDPGAAVELGRGHGQVVVAAHNAPGEWTLSGEPRALAAIAARFPTTRLPVQGAWHSPAMADAVDELEAAMRAAGAVPPTVGWVVNRTGERVDDPTTIPALVAGQLVRPIAWVRTLETFAAASITHVIAVGPSKVMRGLARKTLGARVTVLAAETVAELDVVAGLA